MGLQERLDAAIDAALVDRIVGCVVLVNKDGKEVYARTAGLADREAKPRARAQRHLAPCLGDQADRRHRGAQDAGRRAPRPRRPGHQIPALLHPTEPRWGRSPRSPCGSCFRTGSGLSYETVPDDVSPGMSGPFISLDENLRRLARVPLVFAPGTGWVYGTSIDVLGGVIAAINGSTLEAAVTRYAAGPLGMVDWRFTPTDATRVTANYANGNPPTAR